MQRTGADSERKNPSEAREQASDAGSAPGNGRPVAALQRAVGNQAVQSSVGDGVPDETAKAGEDGPAGTLDERAREDGRETRSTTGAMPTAVQFSGGTALARGDALGVARAGVRGTGRTLPYRSRLAEHVDSVDLSDVRVHADERARRAADSLGANAYAVGTDIAVDETPGLKTVAHEVAHVVQQQHGEQPPGGVGCPGDAYERAADAFAAGVARGESVSPLPSRRGRAGTVSRSPDAVQFQADDESETTEHTVNFRRSDGPYGWTVAYDVAIAPTEVRITVGVDIVPRGGLSDAAVEAVEEETEREFERHFDGRFVLEDAEGTARPLRFEVDFDHDSPHHQVNLLPGSGRDNMTTWHVNSEPITHAHELGHMVGLTDEYVDSSVPDRQSESSPGAYQDHSLMGNYKTEGEDAADVRERHGEAIASDLSSETGSRFSAGMSPTYTVRPGDTLTNIALRVYGTEQRWTAVMLANASRIDDIPVDPGTRLYLP